MSRLFNFPIKFFDFFIFRECFFLSFLRSDLLSLLLLLRLCFLLRFRLRSSDRLRRSFSSRSTMEGELPLFWRQLRA